MNFVKIEAKHNGLIFIIEEDFPEVGVYLYIYENNKCIKDFLYDDIDACKNRSFEEYGVPKRNWK